MSIINKPINPLFSKNNFENYKNQLKAFIKNNILSLINIEDDLKDLVLSDNYMNEIWIPCFTQEGFDDTVSYETFEKLGDNVMETHFSMEVMKKSKDMNLQVNQQILNDLINTYLSTAYQGKYAYDRGWTAFVRTRFLPNIKVAEDLVEAIFGGLYYVGNIIQLGVGDILTKGLMDNFMIGVKITLDTDTIKAVKTSIKEIFQDYLGLKIPQLIVNSDVTNVGMVPIVTYNITLTLDKKALSIMNKIIAYYNKNEKNYNKPLLTNVLAESKGKSKKLVEADVYRKALDTLKSYGLNTEYTKNIKSLIRAKSDTLYNEALKKAKENGFKNIDLSIKKNKDNMSYKTLYGITKDGKKVFLTDIVVTDEYGKIIDNLLLAKYLGKLDELNLNIEN